MKTMLWMRHGKSDWDAGYGADHERPLAKRGARAAAAMGKALSRAGLVPDLVFSSTAVRARTTAELAMEAGGWGLGGEEVAVRHDRGLYDGGASRVIELLRGLPESEDGRDVGTVLITGHQPTWAQVVSELVGGGDLRFVTAAVACVRAEVGRWQEVRRGGCELVFFLPPKLLAKIC